MVGYAQSTQLQIYRPHYNKVVAAHDVQSKAFNLFCALFLFSLSYNAPPGISDNGLAKHSCKSTYPLGSAFCTPVRPRKRSA